MALLMLKPIYYVDDVLTRFLSSTTYGSMMINSFEGRVITEILFLSFVALLSYEIVYSTGIRYQWWEYHAKDIFKEVPVHCAHVYIDVNLALQSDRAKVATYYTRTARSTQNAEKSVLKLSQPVRYHLEFGPDDFEDNNNPDLGSTVSHLRGKVLSMVRDSDMHASLIPEPNALAADSVLIFTRKNIEIKAQQDEQYLVKCGIETGHLIHCVVLV